MARRTVKENRLFGSDMGFDWQTCAVMSTIDKQSPDIAQGVDRANPEDQGPETRG